MTAITNPFYSSKALIAPYSAPRAPQPQPQLPGLLSQLSPTDPTAADALHLTLMSPQFSSWTLRVLLFFEHFAIPYTAEFHNYNTLSGKQVIQGELPGRTVPVLTLPRRLSAMPDGSRQEVHESLAIAILLGYELFPERGILPKDRRLRTYALSVMAEMSSGFSVLRGEYSVNYGLCWDPEGVPRVEGVERDVNRLLFIWKSARAMTKAVLEETGGVDEGYLFGGFGAADSWFWPVLWRFRSYGLLPKEEEVDDSVKRWINLMWANETTRRIGEEQLRERREGVATLEYLETLFDPVKKWEWGDWIPLKVEEEK